MIRIAGALSIVLLVAGVALLVVGAVLPGLIVLVLGFGLGSLVSAVSVTRRVYRSAREWAELARGGARSVKVVSLEPPQGVIFNRDAVVELEITGNDGTVKRLRREIGIPIPQAISWRLLGKVPTPLGSLAEARNLDLAIWKRRPKADPAVAPESEDPAAADPTDR